MSTNVDDKLEDELMHGDLGAALPSDASREGHEGEAAVRNDTSPSNDEQKERTTDGLEPAGGDAVP